MNSERTNRCEERGPTIGQELSHLPKKKCIGEFLENAMAMIEIKICSIQSQKSTHVLITLRT